MTHYRWLAACLLGVSVLAASQANEPPRHIPLNTPEDPDPDRLLAERLARLKSLKDLRDQAQAQGLSNSQLDKLLQTVRDNPDAFKKPEGINNLVGNFLGRKLTPEEEKLVRGLVQQAGAGENPVPTPPGTEPTPTPPTTTGEPAPTPAPTEPTTAPREDDARDQEELRREFLQLAQQFEGWAKSMPESPALQKLLLDLGQMTMNQANNGATGSPGLSVDQLLDVTREFSKQFKGEGFKLPEMPRGNGSLPQSAAVLPHMLSAPTGLPVGLGAVPSFRSLALLVLCVTALVLLMWGIRHYLPGTSNEPTRIAWRLGPWPVDPRRLASRQELVQAFEYLSLQRFGVAALAWNHRLVAERLGDPGWEYHRAAQRLAAAYERARYAPEAGEFDPEVLVEARADLCLLAGAVPA